MVYLHLIAGFKLLYQSQNDEDLGYKLLVTAWVYLAIVNIQSQFFPAPYGKFNPAGSSVSLWERILSVTLSARTSWIVMEIPSLLVSASALWHLLSQGQYYKMLLLCPFTIHYLNRSIIYPSTINNILAKPMPVLCSASAFIFTLFNGVMQSHFIVSLSDINSINTLISFIGIIIFGAGMFINIQSDAILQSLRRGDVKGYKIPRQGLFTLVSCPHYLGEFLEWLGFSLYVQTWASGWFAVFTLLFLGSRALATHTWYHSTFGKQYPSDRKAFIPCIL